MSDSKKRACISRRGFLRATGLGFAGAALAPMIIPARALGREGHTAPSERVTLGMIGTGGMGMIDTSNFLGIREAQIVAVCDTDGARAEDARAAVDRVMTEQGRADRSSCAVVRDWRDLIARPDVDAVCIATPDHWHGLMAVAALRAGKDVYLEKPMTLTIAEGRMVADAVKRHGRVFQLGTQSRSYGPIRHVVELVRNGRLGEVKRVLIGVPQGRKDENFAPQPVPANFDYNMWLGPAPEAPYAPERCHFWFRQILDYSDGTITDLGTHYMDVAAWALGLDRTGPVEVEGRAQYPATGLYNAPLTFEMTLKYANGVVFDVTTNRTWGPRFEGSEGWIQIPMVGPLPETPITASDPRLLTSQIGAGEERVYFSDDHWRNFIECVKSRRPTVQGPETGHRSTTLPHLGTIAFETGRRLTWDPEHEEFPNDPEANAKLRRAPREPWHQLT